MEITAGTNELALMRARRDANEALGLIRQKVLFGFPAKTYQNQVAFDLDGTFAWKSGSAINPVGRWFLDRPINADLSTQPDWAADLRRLSELRDELASDLRERVDTCLNWLDIAARSSDWRVILPALFGGMEAILVPESTGLKSGVVTVRSVAVHVAIDQPFFNPESVVAAYYWRNQLTHGQATREVNEGDALEFAEDRRLWAFRVFSDYLSLTEEASFGNVKDVVAHLDAGPAIGVCRWLDANGGHEVVDEYIKMRATDRKTLGI
ncbi:MAG: hypothetical protein ACYCXN_15370 [Acidimicrobiales bacterium]